MEEVESEVQQITLEGLTFENYFTSELSADEDVSNSRRQVHGACFSRVLPTATAKHKPLAGTEDVCSLIGISRFSCSKSLSESTYFNAQKSS